jgi:hypothetical protein
LPADFPSELVTAAWVIFMRDNLTFEQFPAE